MGRLAFFVALALWALLLSSCQLDAGTAEKYVDRYYATIKAKDFEGAMTFYSPEMFAASEPKVSEEDRHRLLSRLQDKLGDLQSYRVVKWKVNDFVGTGTRSGTYYLLQYQVTYSRCSAVEDITVFKPSGASDADLRIIGHHINSAGLLQ